MFKRHDPAGISNTILGQPSNTIRSSGHETIRVPNLRHLFQQTLGVLVEDPNFLADRGVNSRQASGHVTPKHGFNFGMSSVKKQEMEDQDRARLNMSLIDAGTMDTKRLEGAEPSRTGIRADAGKQFRPGKLQGSTSNASFLDSKLALPNHSLHKGSSSTISLPFIVSDLRLYMALPHNQSSNRFGKLSDRKDQSDGKYCHISDDYYFYFPSRSAYEILEELSKVDCKEESLSIQQIAENYLLVLTDCWIEEVVTIREIAMKPDATFLPSHQTQQKEEEDFADKQMPRHGMSSTDNVKNYTARAAQDLHRAISITATPTVTTNSSITGALEPSVNESQPEWVLNREAYNEARKRIDKREIYISYDIKFGLKEVLTKGSNPVKRPSKSWVNVSETGPIAELLEKRRNMILEELVKSEHQAILRERVIFHFNIIDSQYLNQSERDALAKVKSEHLTAQHLSKEAQTKQENLTKSEDKGIATNPLPPLGLNQRPDLTDKNEVKVMRRINRSCELLIKARDLTETEPSHLEKALPLQRYRRSGKSNESRRKESKKPPKPNVPEITFLEDLKSVNSLPEQPRPSHRENREAMRAKRSPPPSKQAPVPALPAGEPPQSKSLLAPLTGVRKSEVPKQEEDTLPQRSQQSTSQAILNAALQAVNHQTKPIGPTNQSLQHSNTGTHRPSEPGKIQASPVNTPQVSLPQGPQYALNELGKLQQPAVKQAPTSQEGSMTVGDQVNTKQETGSLSRPTHKPSDAGESTPAPEWLMGPANIGKQLNSVPVEATREVFRPQLSAPPLGTGKGLLEQNEDHLFLQRVREMVSGFQDYKQQCSKMAERVAVLEKQVSEQARTSSKFDQRLGKVEVANKILQEFQTRFELQKVGEQNEGIVPEPTIEQTYKVIPQPAPCPLQDPAQNQEDSKHEEFTIRKPTELTGVEPQNLQINVQQAPAEVPMIPTAVGPSIPNQDTKDEEVTQAGQIVANQDQQLDAQAQEIIASPGVSPAERPQQVDELDVSQLLTTRSRFKRNLLPPEKRLGQSSPPVNPAVTGLNIQVSIPAQSETLDASQLGQKLSEIDQNEPKDEEKNTSSIADPANLAEKIQSPQSHSKQVSATGSSRYLFRRTGEKSKLSPIKRISAISQPIAPSNDKIDNNSLIELKKKLDKELQNKINEQLAKICENQARSKRALKKLREAGRKPEAEEQMGSNSLGKRVEIPAETPNSQITAPLVIKGQASPELEVEAKMNVTDVSSPHGMTTRRSMSQANLKPQKAPALQKKTKVSRKQSQPAPVILETQHILARAARGMSPVRDPDIENFARRWTQKKIQIRKQGGKSLTKKIGTNRILEQFRSEDSLQDRIEAVATLRKGIPRDSESGTDEYGDPRDVQEHKASRRTRGNAVSKSHSKRKRRGKKRASKARKGKQVDYTDDSQTSDSRFRDRGQSEYSYLRRNDQFLGKRSRKRQDSPEPRAESSRVSRFANFSQYSEPPKPRKRPRRAESAEQYEDGATYGYYPQRYDSYSEMESEDRPYFGLRMDGFGRDFAEDRPESKQTGSPHGAKPEYSTRSQLVAEADASLYEPRESNRRKSTSKKPGKRSKHGEF